MSSKTARRLKVSLVITAVLVLIVLAIEWTYGIYADKRARTQISGQKYLVAFDGCYNASEMRQVLMDKLPVGSSEEDLQAFLMANEGPYGNYDRVNFFPYDQPGKLRFQMSNRDAACYGLLGIREFITDARWRIKFIVNADDHQIADIRVERHPRLKEHLIAFVDELGPPLLLLGITITTLTLLVRITRKMRISKPRDKLTTTILTIDVLIFIIALAIPLSIDLFENTSILMLVAFSPFASGGLFSLPALIPPVRRLFQSKPMIRKIGVLTLGVLAFVVTLLVWPDWFPVHLETLGVDFYIFGLAPPLISALTSSGLAWRYSAKKINDLE